MERIGVRELRQHASRYLDLVKAGQTVEVTERGQLVALLVPPSREQSAYDRLVAEGRLIPAKRPFVLPEPLATQSEIDSEQALDEQRAERP
jgi:prevent-host-death family protein